MAYQNELRSLARELTLAEERERRRIAADLHDGIAQSLATARLELGLLRADVEGETARGRLETVRGVVAEALEETRSLSFDLSPVCLHKEGLDAAVRWFADHVENRHGLSVKVDSPEMRRELDEDMASLLYRVVRELLLNVVKHADATQATVSMQRRNDAIIVKVQDDGAGFDVSTLEHLPVRQRGFGLFNVRERLSDLGGSLDIESTPGSGTRVTVSVPLREE
jgi:signal transduction histidine kinase